jgi:hypothetical protein
MSVDYLLARSQSRSANSHESHLPDVGHIVQRQDMVWRDLAKQCLHNMPKFVKPCILALATHPISYAAKKPGTQTC